MMNINDWCKFCYILTGDTIQKQQRPPPKKKISNVKIKYKTKKKNIEYE